ncbi:MAG: hypothetical protein GIS02_05805 [Methanosarcinales archaeon]|uniref:Type I restriction modification DNA specificity domain-containing protein n=1 Tax=Candidatus Ethanoperedens thermophilum TaxID=2766897 RepID=A0A848DAM5_9EURY|nr:hypothetical protein [Candidatus Ethanoperedens thermophilum]
MNNMKLKPYPKYKDSGIEWIGEIPGGWEVRKLKTISKIVLGKMLANDDKGNYLLKPYLRAQNIFWENVDVSDIKEMWFSPTEIKIYRLSKNDLLVSEGGEVGRTAIWSEEIDECYIQNSVHKVIISPERNPRYFLYVFETFGLLGYFESIVNRVSIGHLTREKLKEVNCIVPPHSDQTAIANFLDRKIAKGNSLIEKNTKLIELLKERRTALINHAVTKGIDSNAKLKDSGIEWIGEIPEGWEVDKLKRFCKKITDGSHISPETTNEGKYYITVTDVKQDEIDFNNAHFISENDFESLKRNGCQPNITDVLLTKDGTIGRCVVVKNNDFVALSSLGIITPEDNLKSEYLRYYLVSDKNIKQMFSHIRGSALTRLTISLIKELIIIKPPKPEQTKIVQYLDKATAKIDKTIQKIEEKVNLLEEFKKSLINHVVTGKVDVRRGKV